MKFDWLILSTLALVSYSLMSFFITILTRKGLSVSFVLLILGIVATLFFFFQTVISNHPKPQLTLPIILILLSTGILSFLGNLFVYQAANDAPNPGLALAIGGLQGGMVAILAFIFLRDKLNMIQIFGLVLAMISIFLLSIGSSMKNSLSEKDKTPAVKGP